jgi:hypothetical protein
MCRIIHRRPVSGTSWQRGRDSGFPICCVVWFLLLGIFGWRRTPGHRHNRWYLRWRALADGPRKYLIVQRKTHGKSLSDPSAGLLCPADFPRAPAVRRRFAARCPTPEVGTGGQRGGGTGWEYDTCTIPAKGVVRA